MKIEFDRTVSAYGPVVPADRVVKNNVWKNVFGEKYLRYITALAIYVTKKIEKKLIIENSFFLR